MDRPMHAEALYGNLQSKPFIIAGPCVLEDFNLALDTAFAVKEAAEAAGLVAIFKSSYDKANRSSLDSFRGPGLEQGLEWLAEISKQTALPIITDIHEVEEISKVAKVVDILQIPAFLCRQTSLLLAAGKSGKIVSVKKGQFLAPWEMKGVFNKIKSTGNSKILLTERGSSFGYNNLVVDMRSIPIMKAFAPVVMDATHAVQLPGALGASSGGDRSMVATIAKAAVAAGANGVFMECHPNPDKALCDGPNSLHLKELPKLLKDLAALWALCRSF